MCCLQMTHEFILPQWNQKQQKQQCKETTHGNLRAGANFFLAQPAYTW